MVKYKLPYGMQDYVGQECYNKNKVEQELLACFSHVGYSRIETPILEYIDVLEDGYYKGGIRNLFTLTDTDGSILSLRRDMTVPISRVISTKMESEMLPIRLCYSADSFAREGSYLKTRQYAQCGVELIGQREPMSDVEVICLAIRCLLTLGITDFKIELGHVDYVRGVLDELDISDECMRELMLLINTKDRLSIKEQCDKLRFDNETSSLLYNIPTLFGNEEILSIAREHVKNDTSLNALANLEEIYSLIREQGYADYIRFDVGLIKQMDYYKGVTFKAITGCCGSPLLSGGRYDGLYEMYNKSIGATGFAVGVKNILITLDRMNKLDCVTGYDIALGYDKGCETMAGQFINQCLEDNISVVNTFINNIDNLKVNYKKFNCRKYVFVTQKGNRGGE